MHPIRADGLPAGLLAAALLAAACQTGPAPLRFETGPEALETADGLVRVAQSRFDLALVKPGTDLAPFTKVLLEPVSIAYQRVQAADRRQRRGDFPLSERQGARMREIFQQAFERELSRSEVYRLVEAPGPDVLRVTARVIDLVVTAPPESASGSARTFVTQTGAMTLILELSDSETGEVFVRVADRREARASGGDAYQATSANHWSAVRRLARQWASLLRRRLDAVRELPPLPAPEAPSG